MAQCAGYLWGNLSSWLRPFGVDVSRECFVPQFRQAIVIDSPIGRPRARRITKWISTEAEELHTRSISVVFCVADLY